MNGRRERDREREREREREICTLDDAWRAPLPEEITAGTEAALHARHRSKWPAKHTGINGHRHCRYRAAAASVAAHRGAFTGSLLLRPWVEAKVRHKSASFKAIFLSRPRAMVWLAYLSNIEGLG